jgi:hypothetical protein
MPAIIHFFPSFLAFQCREPAARPLSDPKTDQKNQDKRRQNEPRDHNDLDPQFAHGRDIVVDVRTPIKESVTVAKNVPAA